MAAYRYAWRGGKIAATPLDATSPDIESARDLLDETRRKAGELDDALANSNADPRVRRSVQNLVSVLPNRIEDLRPALFRSRLHSLEEDAAAFSAPADERELFPGAIAAINDVVSTGRDLQACYPQLREIEAERLALDLRPDQIPAALQHLKDVADAAERAPNIVERSAIESLKEIAALAAEDAGPLTTQKRTAEGLLVSQNFIDRLVWPLVANAFSREASDTLKEVSRQAKAALVKGAAEGLGAVGKPTVIIGIASVVSLIAGPTLGALAVLAGYGRVARVVDLARRFAKDIGNGKDGSAKE